MICLISIPALAHNGEYKKNSKAEKADTEMSNAEIRKEKKAFTEKVRLMKDAKNHPHGQLVANQSKFVK